MTNVTSPLAADVERPVSASPHRRRFFLVSAVVMLLIVFLGFAPTFYLRGSIPARAIPLPGYLYVHGAVMTAWYLLFLVQTMLVVSNRTSVHRRLGVVSAVLAIGVVGLGVYVTLNMVARLSALGMTPSQQFEQIHVEFIVVGNLFQLVAFGGLVTAAILLRARPQVHRRLMFWAFVLTLGQALTSNRMLGEFLESQLPLGLPALFLVPVISLIGLAMHDWSSTRRVHPATLLGAATFFLVLVATAVVATSPAGRAFVLSLG
jgi:hypothetical protein